MEFKDEYSLYEAVLEGKELHGHTKIELTDVNTGKTEVHESDNIVTNAVRNILRDNYHGTIDVTKVEPLRDLFGGVLCFGSTNTANVDNIIPPNNDDNTLIAHAGQTAHTTLSTLRGNPNALESGVITGGYKYVWDFSTSQGNGTISSLSLTHKQFGDVGLIPFDTSMPEVIDISNHTYSAKISTGTFTRDVSIRHPRRFDTSTGEGISLWINGTTFEEITSRYSTTKIFLNSEYMIPEEISNRTATLTRSFNTTYCAVVEDDTNYYILEVTTNGSSTVYMNTINKSTFAVTNTSFTATGCSVLRLNNDGNLLSSVAHNYLVSYDGTYLYLPSSSSPTFYKVNMSNTADIETLTSNLSSLRAITGALTIGARALGEGMVIGHNFLINGSNVYRTAQQLENQGTTTTRTGYLSLIGGNYPNALMQGQYIYTTDASFTYCGAVILPYLATINNLDSAVTKSSSQTMKITYSITES